MSLSIPRLSRPLLLTLAASILACAASEAEAGPPPTTAAMYDVPPRGELVSVSLERPDGSPLDTYWHQGAVYVAGEQGARYKIRLTNHTGQRLETVVTVDGRDVITGKLGDYRNQRGYILGPYDSITVDGFRQSLHQVAAFRFSDVPDSYSARRGTPQHVGVIGVAVFRERVRRPRPRPRPVYPYSQPPNPYPAPYPYESRAGSSGRRGRAAEDAPAAEAQASPARKSRRSARGRAPADSSAAYGGGADYEYAPAPRNELGTRYGETRTSHVREVSFRRRHRSRPDRLLTVYYDSYRGLAARGVPVYPPYDPYDYAPPPQPWPRDTRFAPPPPPPRY